MAYIMLLTVKVAKNKYNNDEEVNIYTMFHSKVENYMRIHGKDTFFCSTTLNVFTLVPKNEKNTKLLLIVELPDIDPNCQLKSHAEKKRRRISIDDDARAMGRPKKEERNSHRGV